MSEKINPDRKYWDRLFATPAVLSVITTLDAKGRVNAGAFATCVRAVHNPVQIAFTAYKDTHTWDNIRATGEFVINLPSFDREVLEKVCIVGLPFAPGVNELEKAGFSAMPSIVVRPPRVPECKRHFECEVVWTKEWLDRVMITGNVVAASVDDDCIDEQGFVLWDVLKPVMYCGAPYLNQPPHKHRFVAAHETISVDTKYDGPEIDAFRKKVADIDI